MHSCIAKCIDQKQHVKFSRCYMAALHKFRSNSDIVKISNFSPWVCCEAQIKDSHTHARPSLRHTSQIREATKPTVTKHTPTLVIFTPRLAKMWVDLASCAFIICQDYVLSLRGMYHILFSLFFFLASGVCACLRQNQWWLTKLLSKETRCWISSTKGASPAVKKPSKTTACTPGASGRARLSSSWLWRGRSSAWATYGGSLTSATRTEEVKRLFLTFARCLSELGLYGFIFLHLESYQQ